MKRIYSLCALLLCTLTSVAAISGETVGTIDYVNQRASDGLIFVAINGPITGSPSCATKAYFMIANESSDAGKKQFAILLLAKASGLRVAITGSNTCTRWSDGEDINEIRLMD